MRVLHIIPSAFEYFDDIRNNAMAVVNKQKELGIEVEAFTLQYGAVSSKQKTSLKQVVPGVKFVGLFKSDAVISSFDDFDIIHLHLPALGLIPKIIKWKEIGNKQPLVVTYWREMMLSDLFSYFVRWYNYRNDKKIYDIADAIICFDILSFNKTRFARRLTDRSKIINLEEEKQRIISKNIHLTNTGNNIKLTKEDMEALACVSIYDILINK